MVLKESNMKPCDDQFPIPNVGNLVFQSNVLNSIKLIFLTCNNTLENEMKQKYKAIT